jgi:arsenite methyltransferase
MEAGKMLLMTELNLKLLNWEAGKLADKIIRRLPLKNGQRVADIGAGGGAFTLPMARIVGRSGEVYAVDTDSARLAYIGRRARKAGLLEQITLVLGEEEDCLLPEETIDLAFSRNCFHHIKRPGSYFSSLARALKTGGTAVLIDHDGSRGWLPKHGHSSTPERIRSTMKQAGFRFSESVTEFPGQSFQIFIK